MYAKIISNFLVLILGLVAAVPALATECFHVALPQGKEDLKVPKNLDFIRVQDEDLLWPAGFWIFHKGENLALSGPGCFLLEQDIVRNIGLAAVLGEPGGLGPLVSLSNGGIVFDLNGHTLRSDRAGVAIDGYTGGKSNQVQKKELAIRNGKIELRGRGIVVTGWQYTEVPANYRPGPFQLARALEDYGPSYQAFGDSHILLENLTIKSGGLAAYLVGRNNIIRHCHIEVEGHEALALFGANNQLIDNEIIIKRSLPTPIKPWQPPASLNIGSFYSEYAAIWIRDAPGLIIRRNKIVIEGWFNANEAIMLINSPNVVIEDNEITGVNKLFTALDAQSSAHARNNRKRGGKWPDN